jgi:FKBP-type peptidyl-prolyl cis-trans isomerase
MRCLTLFLLFAVALAAPALRAVRAAGAPPLETDTQKTLYVLGLGIAKTLAPFQLSPEDLELVKAGLTDGALGRTPRIDPTRDWAARLTELGRERFQASVRREREAGAEFAERAARRKGARRTSSGLVYQELVSGSGASPGSDDRVRLSFQGELIDGTVFDSSSGEPVALPVDGVMSCWTEVLQLMRVGGRSRVVCPDHLAYGLHGSPPKIGPGATLVFELELHGIEQEGAEHRPES